MAEESLDKVYEQLVKALSPTEQLRLVERMMRELAARLEAEAAAREASGEGAPRRLIGILEDNAERAEAMCTEVRRRAPGVEAVVFDNAPDMIRWLPGNLSALVLLSLDHDLGPSRERDGRVFNPGTGRVVASVLAAMEPACPVVIHSTNVDGALGTKFCLQDAGWSAERIIPSDDLEWIATDWGPRVAELLEADERAP
jgi:hypothetical protein